MPWSLEFQVGYWWAQTGFDTPSSSTRTTTPVSPNKTTNPSGQSPAKLLQDTLYQGALPTSSITPGLVNHKLLSVENAEGIESLGTPPTWIWWSLSCMTVTSDVNAVTLAETKP